MGLASRNLAAINYLHSNKHNFFNNVENFGQFGELQNQDKLNQTIESLEADLAIAKQQEREFYNDFGVSSEQEWSRTYLRIGKNDGKKDNKIAILTQIFHSIELYKILSKHTIDKGKIKSLLKEISASSSTLTPEQKRKINQIISKNSEVSLSMVFDKLGLFGKGAGNKQQNFFQDVLNVKDKIVEETLKELVEKTIGDIKGVLSSKKKGGKLQKLEKLISISKADNETKLIESSNFIETKMAANNKIFTKEDIKKVISMWKELFRHDITHDDGRIVSSSIEKVEGKVQELERRITLSEVFLSFSTDDFFEGLSEEEIEKKYTVAGIKTLVQSTGDKLVKRYRNEGAEKGDSDKKEHYSKGESKTDSIFRGKSGREYRIQEKNSISDMYSQFDSSGDPNDLTREIGQLKLQSEVKFSTLQQYFLEGAGTSGVNGRLFSNEDLQYLAYLMINLNALSLYSSDEDGQLWKGNRNSTDDQGRKKQTAFKASFTIDLIDGIMTRGIKAFVSDLILPDRAGQMIDFQNWNFIIYRGQMLLPLSYIIDQLLLFLKGARKDIITLRTYSKIQDISAGELKDIYTQKKLSTEDDPNKEDKDYHWDNLVNIGVAAGARARENLIINGIYLKFNKQAIQNLITPKKG